MAWPTPQYSRGEVNRAGEILAAQTAVPSRASHATSVLSNWRSCHGYPINTFQATLRDKLRAVDPDALVAQRLKRTPSIISKLRRFPSMKLVRMNDIGGLRAVLATLSEVRDLERNYRSSNFLHELVGEKDYIQAPKASGYRGIHLIYRYQNNRFEARPYNGLLVELQVRTQRQHAWATAVETMGTFLNQALKSSEGPEEWLKFFALSASAFAHLEKTPPVPQYAHLAANATYNLVAKVATELDVRSRLRAFVIVADHVFENRQQGSYHLIVLNSQNKTVNVTTFPKKRLDEANAEYTRTEERIGHGDPLQAVLVSTNSINTLRRAYPNYFLDTDAFIQVLDTIITRAKNSAKPSSLRR